jgi:hypothetical protein
VLLRGIVIDIAALNAKMVEQDEALRNQFAQIADQHDADPATRAVLDLIGAGLAAIHERQGNLITLMLQTAT